VALRCAGLVANNMALAKQKVYELTTNAKDGWTKYYVRGIKDDAEAFKVMNKGFGKFSSKTLISYYDNYPSEYGTNWKNNSYTIAGFIKATKRYRR
jgi:hypothetical protein